MPQYLTLFSSEILRIPNSISGTEGGVGVWGGNTTEIWIQDSNTGCLTSDFMPFVVLFKGFQSCHMDGTQAMMNSHRLVVITREYGLTAA